MKGKIHIFPESSFPFNRFHAVCFTYRVLCAVLMQNDNIFDVIKSISFWSDEVATNIITTFQKLNVKMLLLNMCTLVIADFDTEYAQFRTPKCFITLALSHRLNKHTQIE